MIITIKVEHDDGEIIEEIYDFKTGNGRFSADGRCSGCCKMLACTSDWSWHENCDYRPSLQMMAILKMHGEKDFY